MYVPLDQFQIYFIWLLIPFSIRLDDGLKGIYVCRKLVRIVAHGFSDIRRILHYVQ